MKQNYLILLLFLSLKLLAQNQEIDLTFNTHDSGVYQQNIGEDAVVLPNGKIITSYRKSPYKILLLNSDGSIDKNFTAAQPYASLYTKIFAKSDGSFLLLDDYDRLVAFNADGTLNTTFAVSQIKTTSSDPLYIKVIYQEDGKVVIFGNLNTINGNYVAKSVRLNLDGSVDSTFKLTTGGNAMTIQSDGKYIVSNGPRISRYNTNGTVDNTFKVNTTTDPKQGFITNGFQTVDNSRIDDAIVQPDGKIIVVGCNFVESGKTISYSIVRLNANGTRDTSFKLFTDKDLRFNKVYLQKDNKIIINSNSSTFIRLNTDGTTDTTFKYSNIAGLMNKGDLFFQGEKIVIVADFIDKQGISRYEIHRINKDGSLDLSFNPHSGPNLTFDTWDYNRNHPFAAKVLPDQKVLLVGNFTSYNDNPAKKVCRINQNGEFDPTFKLDPSITIYTEAQNGYQIVPQKDGKILLIHNNSMEINRITKSMIRLNNDGSLDKNFDFADSEGRISEVIVLENGKMFVSGESGNFVKNGTSYNIREHYVFLLNSDGSIDTNYNGKFFHKPNGITLLKDKKFIISFARDNSSYSYTGAIKFNEDGTKDTSFDVSFYPYTRIKELADGKFLVSWDNKIMRLNANGSVDSSFNSYSYAKTYSFTYDRFAIYENSNINLFFSNYATNTTTKITLTSEGNLLNTTVYKNASQFEIQNCEDLLFYGYFDKTEDLNRNGLVRYKTSQTTSTPNPAGEIYQPFVTGQTLGDLKVNGSNVKWYTSQTSCGINNKLTSKGTGDEELPSSTLLVNGTTYYASQTANNLESSYRLPVTVYAASLGVKENQLPNLVTYPNPVKDYYSISNTENITKIELFNILGQLQYSNNYDKNNVEIDFTSLQSGLYFAKIYADNKSAVIKIIKN
jgi:uncharacterized delta-60 repeat protein